MGKAHAMFYRPFAAAKGTRSGRLQITMYAQIGELRRTEAAARFVLEGEGRADDEWTVFPTILNHMCEDVEPVLFDTLEGCLIPTPYEVLFRFGTTQTCGNKVVPIVLSQGSAIVEQIVERLLRLASARTHLPMILALQNDVENLRFSDCVLITADLGPHLSLCQIEFVMYRNQVLFESAIVLSVYAPDSAKDFEEYESFMGEMTKVLLGGRREGARRFLYRRRSEY